MDSHRQETDSQGLRGRAETWALRLTCSGKVTEAGGLPPECENL